ncbi:MAG: GDSL-type esterase/lipase family protein [Elusimicrobia bacterium]|nr:GDSL-type esterase/lipase family protein [Elusimicrobiota bacterium]
MNDPQPGAAQPKGALASRPALARLTVLLLGMLCVLAALELGLAAFGMIYRWRYERRPAPSDGKTVILCLGDSFTQGIGGPPGQSYADQLDALLNTGAEPRYRVVNAGRGNASSTIIRSIFLEQVDKVKPRIVTLMIGGANHWNYAGRHRAGRSRLARGLTEAGNRIRVVKLARLLAYQSRQKSPPGPQEEDSAQAAPGRIPPAQVSPAPGMPEHPDGFWTEWSKGLVRCREAAKRGREVRPDLTAEVVALLESDRRETAQKRIQEALRSRPADVRAHALMGFIHWGNHESAQALASFENARRLDPHDGYAQLGLAALAIQSDPGYKAGAPISRILSALPQDALLCRVSGRLLMENNDAVGASAMFQKSLRIDPCQSRGFVALGDAYERLGRRDEALAMRREASRLDLADPDAAVLAKISSLLSAGRYEEILRVCRSRGPDDAGRAQACREAAESLFRGGDSGEMVLMTDALRLGSYDPKAASARAELASLLRKGGSEEAFRFCRSRCRGDSGWIEPCRSVAESLVRKGVFSEQALQWMRDLERLHPRNMDLLLLAKLERLGGRTREADDLFARVVEAGFPDAVPVLDVAKAYLTPPEHPHTGDWARSGRRLAVAALDFFPYWDEIRNLPMESVLASPLRSVPETSDTADMEAWLRSDVQSIADECRRRGIGLVIMNYPPSPKFVWHDYRYQEMAASAGALFVDVQNAFAPSRAAGSQARYFVPDGHCSAEGNGIVARTLAQGMRTAGLLPRDSK